MLTYISHFPCWWSRAGVCVCVCWSLSSRLQGELDPGLIIGAGLTYRGGRPSPNRVPSFET